MNNIPIISFLLATCMILQTKSIFPFGYSRIQPIDYNYSGVADDPGVPLLLTPLIEAGKIDDARMASQVYFDGFLKKTSYSGYFTVDNQYNSNLFFWFFPSENDPTNAPLLLWLQGGPGTTSLLALFTENGPFAMKSKNGLKERAFAWTKTHSVIYIDNPVGTGYSFTSEGGYAQNQTKIGEHLYDALQQFFLVFPDFQSNDFYVTGESYAGKYVPAVAYTIYQKNKVNATKQINLKGLAIGNGYCDPINQNQYADYLYQLGLYDSNTQTEVKKLEEQGIEMIRNKQYKEAAVFFDSLIGGDYSNSTVYENVTGFSNYLNYLDPVDPLNSTFELIGEYIQRNDVRAAIHVGNATFNDGKLVEQNLLEESVQSVAPWISELLDHYRILFYNGQLDIIVGYPLTLKFLQNLNFTSAAEYKNAKRQIWHVQDDIAGYVKQAGNLTEILVRDAGHMVPTDQEQWAFDMISRFTRNKPFNSTRIGLIN